MVQDNNFKEFIEKYFGVSVLSAEAKSGIGAANFRDIEGRLDSETIKAILSSSDFYVSMIDSPSLKIGAYNGSFQGKSSQEITYLLNSISSIDLSMSVPVLRVAFIPAEKKVEAPTTETGKGQKISRIQRNVSNIVAMNSPGQLGALERKHFINQGSEIYLYPQHLWTKEKNSMFSEGNRAVKPFVPLWTINNATIEVSESDYGPIFYEYVTLSMILNDVSRLPEVIPLINPNFHTTVAIEFGWETSLSERHGMGFHIFNMKRELMCRVINFDINMTGERKAEITLTMMTDGYDIMRKISLSNKYLKEELQKYRKAVEYLEQKVNNIMSKTTDVTFQKSLKRIGEFVQEGDIDKLTRKQRDRTDVKKIINLSNNVSDEISSKITKIFNNSENQKVLEAANKMFEKSNNNIKGVDDKKALWKSLSSGVSSGKYTTLAMLMKVLLEDLAKEKEFKKETFVFFGNANKFSGALGGKNLGAYIIRKDTFAESLKRHLVARRSVDLTFSDIISTIQSDLNNLKNINYGLRDVFTKWQWRDEENPIFEDDLNKWQRRKLDRVLVNVGSFNIIEDENGEEKESAMFMIPNVRFEVVTNDNQQAIIVYDTIDMKNITDLIDSESRKAILNKVFPKGSAGNLNTKTGKREKSNFRKLKNELRHSVPYALIGTERTGIKSFAMSTVGDDELETIYLLDADKLNDAGSSKDWITNLQNTNSPEQYMPFSFFPLECEMTTVGIPFLTYNQKIFVDLNTDTTVDSIYNTVKVVHQISPGEFSTKINLKPMGGYAYYSAQLDETEQS